MDRPIADLATLEDFQVDHGTDQDYWSFHDRSEREFSHAYLQYPAMMVPQMQGEILDQICAAFPGTRHVWDPFVGSGTSLGECMLRGLDFTGNDINPLAVLISKTKQGPLNVEAIRDKAKYLFASIAADTSTQIEVNFPGLTKWFTSETAIQLSKIRRAIQSEKSLWARRFLWVALAETIRLTSNSRTSTYKLHIRDQASLARRRKSPIKVFESTVETNIGHLGAFKDYLSESGYAIRGNYTGATSIRLLSTSQLPENFLKENPVDLIITSPPYGDNKTTIPYGQYSYLPLNWIALEDIDAGATPDYLAATSTIDSMSLGGSLKEAVKKAEKISDISPRFKRLHDELGRKSIDCQKKVASFMYDLDSCIDPLLDRLAPGGHLVWTLGNRMVANTVVPLDEILQEFFESRGTFAPMQFERKIRSKRMASRNSVSDTMRTETIVVMQKSEK